MNGKAVHVAVLNKGCRHGFFDWRTEMLSAIFTLGQILSLIGLAYGAILALGNRKYLVHNVASALREVERTEATIKRSLALAHLARTDPRRAAALLRPLTAGQE